MSHYRIRARFGEVEIEVESSENEFAESKLKELMATPGSPKGAVGRRPQAPSGEAKTNTPADAKPLSMVEHVRALSPKSGTQFVVAIGDYLEQWGGMADGFRTKDIAEGFRTVTYKHANPGEAVRSAKQQGFLMDGREPGTTVVTHTAEAWVRGQLAREERTA